MVFLESKPTQIIITRNYRDFGEIIFTFSSFIIIDTIIILYYSLIKDIIQAHLILLLIILAIILLYYLLPNNKTIIDLSTNSWITRKYYLYLPFHKVRGNLTELDSIISHEIITNKKKNSLKSSFNNQYIISFEFWEMKTGKKTILDKEDEENEDLFIKKVIFYRKTYSRVVFLKEMENIRKLGRGIAKYFSLIGLDIKFDIIQENMVKG